MLKSLQSLRGIYAIMIFLHHFPVDGKGLFAAGGDCGVDFFIMLSGFVMSAGYFRRLTEGNERYSRYMWRRVARLYPLHLLCLAFYLLLYGSRLGIGSCVVLLPNLLLLQSWIPVEAVYFSGNAVSWCLSDLMFCYAIFPFLAMFCHRTRKWFTLCTIAATAAYFALIWFIPDRLETALIYIFPPTRLLDFVWGMILWTVYSGIKPSATTHKGGLKKSVAELAAIGITVAGCIYFGDITSRLTLASYWWIPSAVMIMTFAVNDGNGGIVSKALSSRPLVAFGNVSFSFYMLHVLLITCYRRLVEAELVPANPWIALPALLIITTGLSFLVYYKYEKPIGTWLNGKR